MPKPHRGITFVTVLILAGAVALVGWIVTYGPAYWDNTSVNRVLKEAANMCYQEHDDEKVKNWVFARLHKMYDTGAPDGSMYIDVDREDLRIERKETPPWVDIWLTYSRTVRVPLVDQDRTVTFVDHVDQDLSPVKW